MVAKTKISKAKHNNQKKNKLVKRGVIKKKSKKGKNFNFPQPAKAVEKPAVLSDNESEDDGEDLLRMVDEEDLHFMKNAIEHYDIYKKLRKGKRKRQDAEEVDESDTEKLEEEYTQEVEEPKPKKGLLPLKGRDGIIRREVEVEEEENEDECEDENEDDGEDAIEEEEEAENTMEEYSTAQLLAKRNQTLEEKKLEIGVLSSSILENPEEKIMNLSKLLKILEEDNVDAKLTVKKLAIVALLEVFKDLLPEYAIRQHEDTKEVKLKKDTLKLQKYENTMLQFYKKYLQKLEKIVGALNKKFGDSRKRSQEELILAEVSVKALSDLLVEHPYFNYSQNIAQVLVPFLNSPNKNVREIVKNCCKTVFKEDKKDEITLKILRVLNHYLKARAHNVNASMLEILLSLRIQNVNLDEKVENDLKQKKLKSHKGNVMQLSKKERKRKKKLQALEKELLETKAEENKQSKQKNITEITKIVFGIYFRILKSCTNTKVVGICLEGLAKFAHSINFDFYVDIVNVLQSLLKEDFIGYREKLFIIQTVFTILSGVGEAINLDPIRFYNALYENLADIKATKEFTVLLDSLTTCITKRRKKITLKRLLGFLKRLMILSLSTFHPQTLALLSFVRSSITMNSQADILLDTDNDLANGEYNPWVNDPEYSNASGCYLYELTLLRKHFHPVVQEFVKHFVRGCPTTGDGSLAISLANKTPRDIFDEFDFSEMAFKPSIPIPKKGLGKSRPGPLNFVDNNFKAYCYRNLDKNRYTLL